MANLRISQRLVINFVPGTQLLPFNQDRESWQIWPNALTATNLFISTTSFVSNSPDTDNINAARLWASGQSNGVPLLSLNRNDHGNAVCDPIWGICDGATPQSVAIVETLR